MKYRMRMETLERRMAHKAGLQYSFLILPLSGVQKIVLLFSTLSAKDSIC